MPSNKQLPPWTFNFSPLSAPPTPFYLYSETRLRNIIEAHKAAFAHFPIKVQHHFAFKCNNNSTLLRLLRDEHFGADVVSGNELELALKHGYSPDEIVFSGVGKTRRELELAIEKNISLLNIESEFEFEMLDQILEGSSKKIKISFRINPNVNAKSHPYISTGLKSHKFGLPLKRAKLLFQRAARRPHFDVCGVDVHIGSQLLDLRPLEEALNKTLDFLASLPREARSSLRLLDVGGGLGVDYKNPSKIPNFIGYAKILRKIALRWSKECLHPQPEMLCENGRAIAAQCGLLVTRVIGVKESTPHPFLIVDASMSELMRPSLYQARHEIIELFPAKSRRPVPYTVAGPVCESSDIFGKGFRLAKSLKENDLLGIKTVGAYGATMSHFYNVRDLPGEYWLNPKNELSVSRKRLSFAEAFSI